MQGAMKGAMFEIIPVIDLLDGAVVHARRGARAQYRPIATPLCAGSAPLAVVGGLLALHPFRTLYVADLDAIAGRAGHDAALRTIAAAHPAVSLWLDNGAADAATLAQLCGAGPATLVLGSETQSDAALLAAHKDDPRVALSLDFRGDVFQGPRALLDTPALWPARVIAMTLAQVGSGAGPDFARLATVKAAAGQRAVYAAGGLRGLADARALAAMGIAGALVATALHDGRLSRADLVELAALSPG